MSRKKKLIIVCVIVLLIILGIYYLMIPKYEFEYYYSKDKKKVITRIEYKSAIKGNYTYFTPGHYDTKDIPKMYIKPIYSGINGGFDILIDWRNKGINLYSVYGNYDNKNLTEEFNFKKIDLSILNEMYSDTLSGNFTHVHEKPLF